VTSSATAITYTFGTNESLYCYMAVVLLVTIGLLPLIALSVLAYSTLGIYLTVVWTMVAVGTLIILAGLKKCPPDRRVFVTNPTSLA
jgi:ABC-type sugar transport system permease subunit